MSCKSRHRDTKQVILEDKIGSLEAGKYADMAWWERDLYTVPTKQLREIKALKTFVNGKLVYEA
ncbi:MAG: amidohydrolase family protein [Candidatus Bathyarchaeota archaeon]